jgi:hypothetical protein
MAGKRVDFTVNAAGRLSADDWPPDRWDPETAPPMNQVFCGGFILGAYSAFARRRRAAEATGEGRLHFRAGDVASAL